MLLHCRTMTIRLHRTRRPRPTLPHRKALLHRPGFPDRRRRHSARPETSSPRCPVGREEASSATERAGHRDSAPNCPIPPRAAPGSRHADVPAAHRPAAAARSGDGSCSTTISVVRPCWPFNTFRVAFKAGLANEHAFQDLTNAKLLRDTRPPPGRTKVADPVSVPSVINPLRSQLKGFLPTMS